MAVLNTHLAFNTFIWMCMLSQIHGSVASPTKQQDKDDAELIELMTGNKHISLTSEKLEEHGTENERNKRSITELKDCDEDQLLSYLSDIQEINPDSIINLKTKKNVSHLCKKVAASMKIMDRYIETCEFLDKNGSYMSLIKAVKTLYVRLCKTGSFKTEFMKYLSCYHDRYKEYDSCVGPNNWMKTPGQKFICRVYHQLEECYYNVTLQPCGKNAARNMKKFVGWVTDSVVTITCDNIRHSAKHQADAQDVDALDVSPEISVSMNPLLAAYIYTGVTLTVIMILLFYFFVTRPSKSARSYEEESRKQPLLHNTSASE